MACCLYDIVCMSLTYVMLHVDGVHVTAGHAAKHACPMLGVCVAVDCCDVMLAWVNGSSCSHVSVSSHSSYYPHSSNCVRVMRVHVHVTICAHAL